MLGTSHMAATFLSIYLSMVLLHNTLHRDWMDESRPIWISLRHATKGRCVLAFVIGHYFDREPRLQGKRAKSTAEVRCHVL